MAALLGAFFTWLFNGFLWLLQWIVLRVLHAIYQIFAFVTQTVIDLFTDQGYDVGDITYDLFDGVTRFFPDIPSDGTIATMLAAVNAWVPIAEWWVLFGWLLMVQMVCMVMRWILKLVRGA